MLLCLPSGVSRLMSVAAGSRLSLCFLLVYWPSHPYTLYVVNSGKWSDVPHAGLVSVDIAVGRMPAPRYAV